MSLQLTIGTIPKIKLNIDQLLTAIRQIDESARVKVAQVLMETHMDAKLANLIEQLANTSPVNDISDADIEAEIKAVRRLNR